MNCDFISNMFQRTTLDTLDEIYKHKDKFRMCLLVNVIKQEIIIKKLELKKSCTYYWEDEQGEKYDNFWCKGSKTEELVIGQCEINSNNDEYWRNLRKLHSRY